MGTIATVAVTCWVCACIATPRKPLPGSEVQELVYIRLLGRQQWLALLAGAASMALLLAVVLGLPQHVDTTRSVVPVAGEMAAGCNDEMLCPWMYEQR